jgi:uncharacterized protein (TIGR00369 family)
LGDFRGLVAGHGGGQGEGMEALPRTRSCFVCGTENPLGLDLDVASDRRVVEARLRFRPEHAGLSDTVHGGLLSTVLDEMMAWACGVATRRLAYCAEMTVRFVRPVAPGIEVTGRGELVENRRGRLFMARAELRNPAGEILAEATGKFMPVPGELQRRVLADFAADPTEWLDGGGTV